MRKGGVHEGGQDNKGVSLPSAHQSGLRSCFCHSRSKRVAPDVAHCPLLRGPALEMSAGVRNTTSSLSEGQTSGCWRHRGVGCCRATWSSTAEPISSVLISSTGRDWHQLKRSFLPLPSLSYQLRSRVSSTCPLVLETHPWCWWTQGQCSGMGTAVPHDSAASPHCRAWIIYALDIKHSAETQHYIQQLCCSLCGNRKFITVTLLWKAKPEPRQLPQTPLLLWHVKAFYTWYFRHILVIDGLCL